MSRFILSMCMIMGVGGCVAPKGSLCAPGFGPQVTVFTLFLGKAIPGRGDLTDQEWILFLNTTVTDNLPNGYTVFDANGGWMNPMTRQTIQEGTKVLLVALPDVPESLAAINRIRTTYQIKFRQQLVGMTVAQACGAF